MASRRTELKLSQSERSHIRLLAQKHAASLERARKQLAMNFDVSAQIIISDACREMGILRTEWEKINQLRLELE